MQQFLSRFTRWFSVFRKHAYLANFVLLATLTSVLLIFFLFFSYRQTENTIKSSSANEAHILASQMDATLRRIRSSSDLVTENILHEALSGPLTPHRVTRINSRLNALGRYFPEVLGHLFFNAEGHLLFSSDPALEKLSIVKRAYFEHIKEHPQSGIFFSETLNAKTTQTRTVVAYQTLLGDAGEFQGILATPIDLRFFEGLFAKMDVGSQGMVSIRRSDNSRLVVRWPEVLSGLNNEAKDIPPQQRIQAGVAEGVVRYIGRTDGLDRIFAFHSIPDFPFYVLVGRAVDEQFAGWYKMATISSTLTCTGILLLGLFLYRLKKSEHRVQRSEIRYQAIVENQHDAVCRWLPDTTLTFANAKYKELFSSEDKKLIGRRWVEFASMDKREAILANLSHFDKLQKTFSIENSVVLQDGTVRNYHWVAGPLLDSSGKCIEFQSVGRDITERKQAEETVRERELFLRTILHTTVDGFWVCSVAGIMTEVNDAYCAMLGYSKEEILGMHINNIDDVETPEKTAARIKRIIANGSELFETRHRRKDGSVFTMEVSSTFMQENGGQFVCFCRDLTERKRFEETLQTTLERTQIILSNINPGILLVNNENRVEFVNQSCCVLFDLKEMPTDLLGLSAAELMNKVNDMFIDFPGAVARIQSILAQNQPIENEQVAIKGGRTYLRDYIPVIIEGKKYGRLWQYYDITEQKQADEERKSLQAQLIQAQKMEAIGTLAGGIAHDFNNILGAVLGYAEMARDGSPSGSEVAKDLDRVLEASHRAVALVKQILAFSRQADTERIPLDPSHMVGEAIKLLRPTLPSTIAITQNFEKTQPIFADPTHVHQIVMNLCTNAFHAMEQTGGTLDISLKDCELSPLDLQHYPDVKPGKFVVLTICDSGPGIPLEIRDKIFDPYFTTKEVGKGTGMGLAIVHGIVTTSGGFVTCESELGKGTVFKIFFPAIEQKITPEARSVEGTPTGKERILLVDDEDILVEMGQAMLERLGYEVTICTNSLEALATFQNQPDRFDAVVTDQTMPGMTGIDLARRMLQIRPDLPIVLCTGYSNLINEEQAMMFGIKGFAMKPITRKGIATLLRKVLD